MFRAVSMLNCINCLTIFFNVCAKNKTAKVFKYQHFGRSDGIFKCICILMHSGFQINILKNTHITFQFADFNRLATIILQLSQGNVELMHCSRSNLSPKCRSCNCLLQDDLSWLYEIIFSRFSNFIFLTAKSEQLWLIMYLNLFLSPELYNKVHTAFSPSRPALPLS